jgi:hypothetical protein
MICFYLSIYTYTYTMLYYTYHGALFDLFAIKILEYFKYVQKNICSDIIHLVFLYVQTLYVKYLYVDLNIFRRYTLRRYTLSIYTFRCYTFGHYMLGRYT